MLRLGIFLVCVCMSLFMSAQHKISGTVLNAESQQRIPFAYIENTTRNYLMLSDSTGSFDLFVQTGDTVLFSSLGFFWKKLIVHDSISDYLIEMSPKVYELETVTKFAHIPFAELQQKILAMPMPEDTLKLNLRYEKYFPMKEYQPGQISYSVDGVITALYNSTNRHARNRLRAMELLNEAHRVIAINKKISTELIKDITRLSDEYIEPFVVFCEFSDEFLYESNEMLIISYVYMKLDEFLKQFPQAQF
jgi:hypothetical protein